MMSPPSRSMRQICTLYTSSRSLGSSSPPSPPSSLVSPATAISRHQSRSLTDTRLSDQGLTRASQLRTPSCILSDDRRLISSLSFFLTPRHPVRELSVFQAHTSISTSSPGTSAFFVKPKVLAISPLHPPGQRRRGYSLFPCVRIVSSSSNETNSRKRSNDSSRNAPTITTRPDPAILSGLHLHRVRTGNASSPSATIIFVFLFSGRAAHCRPAHLDCSIRREPFRLAGDLYQRRREV